MWETCKAGNEEPWKAGPDFLAKQCPKLATLADFMGFTAVISQPTIHLT